MRLERVSAALAPAELVGDGSVEVRDLAYAPRAVRDGALFFCVPGTSFDGHDLAPQAAAAGAVALAVERHVSVAVPQIVVPSVRAAMPAAAVAFFGDPSRELPVIGVTG